jgi:hypothetical protein
MSTSKAVLGIVVGLASIVFGLTRKQFYAAGIYNSGRFGKPVARWKGRMLFAVI